MPPLARPRTGDGPRASTPRSRSLSRHPSSPARDRTPRPPTRGGPVSQGRVGRGIKSPAEVLPPEFQVPAGELGTCLGAADASDYRSMSRRLNDGIYVKKLRPNTCAGPLKVGYDYTHRTAAATKHTTQEGTIVFGAVPLGTKNTKDYKEMSGRVHDGIYSKMFGYVSMLPRCVRGAVPCAETSACATGKSGMRS
jgi:hypothetical protein